MASSPSDLITAYNQLTAGGGVFYIRRICYSARCYLSLSIFIHSLILILKYKYSIDVFDRFVYTNLITFCMGRHRGHLHLIPASEFYIL